jgi:hypothetical protein
MQRNVCFECNGPECRIVQVHPFSEEDFEWSCYVCGAKQKTGQVSLPDQDTL